MFWSGEQWRVFSVLLFNERVGNRFLGKAENKSIVARVYLGQHIESLLESLECAVALVLPRVAGR